MGIESKHSYRFVYLKSDKWKNARLEALVREGGKCQICGEESINNDAHHLYYPDSFWDTTSDHLIVLCRPCHDLVHELLPHCKHSDREQAESDWAKLILAINTWRLKKLLWTYQIDDLATRAGIPKQLRTAFEAKVKRVKELEDFIAGNPIPQDGVVIKTPSENKRFKNLLNELNGILWKYSQKPEIPESGDFSI